MKFKKMSALALVAAMMMGTMSVGVNAAADAPQTDGAYDVDVMMMNASNPSAASMSNSIFDQDASITIAGDVATIEIYVANPLPNYPDGYANPFINVVAGADAVEAKSIETKAETRIFDVDGAMFGITAGAELSADRITIELPKSELLKDYIDVSGFVAAVMNADVDLAMSLKNYTAAGEKPVTPEDETDTKSTTVTATVPVNASTYSVTVPASVDLGELSMTEDTVSNYDVQVSINKGNDGLAVNVTTAAAGELLAGEDKIAFTNTFGVNGIGTYTETTTAQGTLAVEASALENVGAATYNGTLNFDISTNK